MSLENYEAASGILVPVWTLEIQTVIEDFDPDRAETYPMVEVKISIERDEAVLAKIMDAVHHVHHYEEPAIVLREVWARPGRGLGEAWASRANYDPDRANPNRFWNNGRGLPDRIARISDGPT